jgi:hypothetical protein
MNKHNKGYVESISHIPSLVGDRKTAMGTVKSVTEGGGSRQLVPGDCVAHNEKIITDNGMCVVIEYPMDTGMLVRVYM